MSELNGNSMTESIAGTFDWQGIERIQNVIVEIRLSRR